ncbi:hypothetical protein CEUSTIGMA_g3130.t1 [Chlamydomonas eustigma]|uniref:mTERF domain-containing protein, mitochondrial n=1 Tax=Chlamydomonas eustigma TaxID=1157962 RepID=A0A250WXX7_9CHLO|nr:hypothetical protein CEUSTIGMA_g3130.t1 [Chlamydomonas eustigma]|eukprot:GAX75687.1 hypothetical protein CEUSTIGMA_g3130.t1 [Chlamydomonas eustigma]
MQTVIRASGICLGPSFSRNTSKIYIPDRETRRKRNDVDNRSRTFQFSSLGTRQQILHCIADGREINPLELLRYERDLAARSQLLSSLDSRWSICTENYCPTEVEQLITNELGVDRNSVMMLAVSNANGGPILCSLDPASVRATIAALKAANVDVSDIWFLASKRPTLLGLKEVLQRWLDFLLVYGLKEKDLVNFLLRAPMTLFENCTIYEAGQVVTYLKKLGIKDAFLATRVFSVWPEILQKKVDEDLRPLVAFMLQIGIEVSELESIMCIWPELLLCSVEKQLAPFCDYLRGIGCSTAQLAQMLTLCPHLLGFSPEELFGQRLRNLSTLGIGPGDVKSMISKTLTFLTAPGGVQPPISFLLGDMNLDVGEARIVILSEPAVLAEKDFELHRKWKFIRERMNYGKREIMSCPRILCTSLMQVLGPRHSFLKAKHMDQVLDPNRCIESESKEPSSTDTVGDSQPSYHNYSSAWMLMIVALLGQEDEDWCGGLGLSYTDFREHAVQFQTDYTEQITQESAREFQDELKKLGIYEGSD